MKDNGIISHLPRLMFVAVLLLCVSIAHAQSKVQGRVTDASGEPIIGASVIVQGTSTGGVTDLDGNYTVANVPAKGVLQFSYVGYTSQNVPVDGRTVINVTLKEDALNLEEVVVVGYGVQRKTDVTGALTRVNSKELNSKPVSNAFEALQGKAAGVDITTSERPGTVGEIRIRGTRSINASSAPLYVVDGVPLNFATNSSGTAVQGGGIDAINPRDIESIDILKDASSTAIYGSRGANGVVLITTKRGKEGKMQLSYSGSFTFENIKDKSPAMSASDYITWRRWAYHNSNPELYARGDQPNYEQDQVIFSQGGDMTALANVNRGWNDAHDTWNGSRVIDTDWTDFVTRTGFTQEHTISASGGNKNMSGFVSFGYLNNEGTQKGQEYQRYTLSASTDIQGTPWFKMGGSINASYSEQDYGYSRTGQVGTSSGPEDLYSAAKAIMRYTLPYDENGELINVPGGSVSNTYTVIDEWTKSTDNRQSFRALGSFYAQIDFGKIWKPLEGLMFKTQFGPDFRYHREGIFIDASSAARFGGNNYTRRQDQRDFAWTWDNMILYNKTFGQHNVGVTLLQSASKTNAETSSMNEENVPIPTFMWNNMGAVDITNSTYKVGIGTGLTESQLASYMARVNYSFKDRYMLTVSGRYDGSSVLADGNKWSFFPSAALGWRMEQEEFMKDITWIDQLKLRLGVGVTGNSAVAPYGTLGVISSYWMPFSTGNTEIYVTNEPFYVDMTKYANLKSNADLGWEKTTQWNFGIDFSVLRGRIGGTIDFYTSRTTDLLLKMTTPSLSGYPAMMGNIGETKNKGVDITLNAIPVMTKDFMWNTTLNAAWSKDEIVELANGKEDDIANAWFIGESIAVYYGYDNAGLWQESDAEEMAKFNENGHNFSAGMVRPVDQNGDYKIDDEDRVILGNQNPRWTLGWSNTFSYKGFELSIELFGRFGYMVNYGAEAQYGMYQQREISYWTPDNTGADYQKPIYSVSGGDPYSSLLGFKDASFIKIRNLSLGYNFDKKLLSHLGISGLKLYVQGKNLGCLYSSVDYMDLDTGVTYYNRGVTFGLQLDF